MSDDRLTAQTSTEALIEALKIVRGPGVPIAIKLHAEECSLILSELAAVTARAERAEKALREIAGTDPSVDGIHWVGDELNPELCPGCIARAALAEGST